MKPDHSDSSRVIATRIARGIVPSLAMVMTGLAHANTITVDSTLDEVTPVAAGDGECTLREAIANANNNDQGFLDCAEGNGDDDIIFDDSIAGGQITVAGVDNQFVVTDTLSITGDVGNPFTIDGNDANRHFLLSGGTLTVTGLTLQNGRAPEADGPPGPSGGTYGGSIYAQSGTTLNVIGCTIRNNRATEVDDDDADGYGGGIAAYDATVNVASTTLSGNVAYYGGAIDFYSSTGSVLQSTLTSNNAPYGGGGISAYDSTLDVSSSTISDNGNQDASDVGGGLFSICSDTTVRASEVTGNTSTIFGGGLMTTSFSPGGVSCSPGDSSLTINDSTISGNTTDGGGGGAVSFTSNLVIDRSVLTDNNADQGGGVTSLFSSLTISDSTISDNTATDDGGGILSVYAPSTATVDGSTITGNSTQAQGGGIANYYGSITLTNSTISGNNADIGGGIWSLYGGLTVNLNNSTVIDNSAATTGGGIFAEQDSVNINNSLVVLNTAEDCASVNASFSGIGDSLDSDATCVAAFMGGPGITTASEADLNIDSNLADNGGAAQTHALLTTPAPSVAIDGVMGQCPPPVDDQRDAGRPAGAACDIGAYEANASILNLRNRSAGARNALATDMNVVTLDVEATAPGSNIDSIRLTELRGYYNGTGSPNDLADTTPVKVWLDAGNSGDVTGPDTDLSTAGAVVDLSAFPEFRVFLSGITSPGTIDFAPGQTRRYLATFDFDGSLDYAMLNPAATVEDRYLLAAQHQVPGAGWMQSATAADSSVTPNEPRSTVLWALAVIFTVGIFFSGVLPRRFGIKVRKGLFVGAVAMSLIGGCPGRGPEDDDDNFDDDDGAGRTTASFALDLAEVRAETEPTSTGAPLGVAVSGLPAATPMLGARVRVSP